MQLRNVVVAALLTLASVAAADPPPSPDTRPVPPALEKLRAARDKHAAPGNEQSMTNAARQGPAPQHAAVKAMQAAAHRVRREQARKQRYRVLREELKVSQVPAPIRAELRTHALRVSRLMRIRALAVESDPTLVVRIDALLSRENARHDRRMTKLIEQANQNARARASERDREPDDDEVEE